MTSSAFTSRRATSEELVLVELLSDSTWTVGPLIRLLISWAVWAVSTPKYCLGVDIVEEVGHGAAEAAVELAHRLEDEPEPHAVAPDQRDGVLQHLDAAEVPRLVEQEQGRACSSASSRVTARGRQPVHMWSSGAKVLNRAPGRAR